MKRLRLAGLYVKLDSFDWMELSGWNCQDAIGNVRKELSGQVSLRFRSVSCRGSIVNWTDVDREIGCNVLSDVNYYLYFDSEYSFF